MAGPFCQVRRSVRVGTPAVATPAVNVLPAKTVAVAIAEAGMTVVDAAIAVAETTVVSAKIVHAPKRRSTLRPLQWNRRRPLHS